MIICQMEHINTSITGDFPKALTLSNERLLIFHSKGYTIFENPLLSLNFTTKDDPAYYTDTHSNVFQLESKMFILMNKSPLVLTLFNESTTGITEQNHLNTDYRPSYHYSIISTSKDTFLITSESQGMLYNIDSTTIRSGKNFTVEDATKLTCDHSYVFLCSYIKNNHRIFAVYNMELVYQKDKDIGVNTWDNAIVRKTALNLFVICFKENNFYCSQLEVKLVDSEYSITYTTPVIIAESIESTGTFHLHIENNSFFSVVSSGRLTYFNHRYIDLNTISKAQLYNDTFPKTSAWIYTITKKYAGYVYIVNGNIYIFRYQLPLCENKTLYSTISSQILVILDTYTFNDEDNDKIKTMFYSFPQNAVLISQDNKLIMPNNKYDLSYTISSLKKTGKETWLYSAIYEDDDKKFTIGSQLCSLDITICYTSCSECAPKSNGNETDHKCTKCAISYFHLADKTENCVNESTKKNYYYDNDVYKKCHESCQVCNGKAETCEICEKDNYPLEDNISTCQKNGTKVNGYYLDQRENYIPTFRKCYSTCETCESSGTKEKNNCTACLTTHISSEWDATQCIPKCSITNVLGKWYVDDKKDIKCSELKDKCPLQYPYTIQINDKEKNECTNNCNHYNQNCTYCQQNHLYLFKTQCIDVCPKEYRIDYQSNRCVEISPNPDSEYPSTTRIKIYLTENTTELWTVNNYSNYKDLLKNETDKSVNTTVDLIYHVIGNTFKLTFFKINDINVVSDVYNKNEATMIDFTNFTKGFDEKRLDDIVVMQLTITRQDQYSDQTEYTFIDSKTDKPLVITRLLAEDSLPKIMMTVPIRNSNDPFIQQLLLMSKSSIDLYDRMSPFYNDICYKYVDTSHYDRDIPVVDRRIKYYPSTELCDSRCSYLSLEQQNNGVKIKCLCNFNNTFTYDLALYPKTKGFNDTNFETYNTLKCITPVFTHNNVLTNASFWLFIIFCALIIIFAFCFIYSGMTYANDYIGSIIKESNNKTQIPNDEPLASPIPKIDLEIIANEEEMRI